jgi:tetratricopeptide (TPR) repeat protein
MLASSNSLREFVAYCQTYLRGDEKSEGQIFLNQFFRAFGHDGVLEVGATFEQRVKKGSQQGKTGFADLVWRSRPGVAGVLIEMKSRGIDLSKHYSQLERYWTKITPNRPRYAILCNFDEFWIFDFENQVDDPIDLLALEDLPNRLSALRFMEVGGQAPVFNNNQVAVTERTARRMGDFFQSVLNRGRRSGFRDFTETQLQRFTLQCVMAMFAEDRQLLPNDLFISLIQECKKSQGSTYDLLGGLFMEMNRPGKTPAGRFQGVDYFNGGLFSEIQPIDLTDQELNFLDVCARDNWANIRPSIFGNIFESAIDDKKRHAHGIHFTSEVDIRQIVRPTISDYWEGRIEHAGNIGQLNQLKLELQSYRVLDPACGSGNFLYVAYQELKRLERLLIDRIADLRRGHPQQIEIGFVTPLQFYGMDTNNFAVQLARVTMMIARKIAVDKYHLDEPILPLNSFDKNIVCQDALFTEWPKVHAVIGNPPFLGGKHTRMTLGDDYMDRVFTQFDDVKDSVDFCTYWFRLTHDHLGDNGRAGLVGTNSISQGKSRTASLQYIVENGGYIHEAISSQPWSGKANVHVSIVNWSRKKPKVYRLNQTEVERINTSLSSTIDVTGAETLSANKNVCFQGVLPVGLGFVVTDREAKNWIRQDPKNAEVLKLYSMGTNLTQNPKGIPDKWIIDFNNMSLEEACKYKLIYGYICKNVKPERSQNRDSRARDNWWRFLRPRPAMREKISPLSLYFAVPRVSSWAVFLPAEKDWLPGDKSIVVASDDFYVLGILNSVVHTTWVQAQKSTLKSDIAYTHTTCFETFPFPQFPNPTLVDKIRKVAISLHEYRSEEMVNKNWGITKLYNEFFYEPASQLHKLHSKLDELVKIAYGFKSDSDEEILEKLFYLNLKLSENEKKGELISGLVPIVVSEQPEQNKPQQFRDKAKYYYGQIDICTQYLNSYPEDASIYVSRGNYHYLLGKYQLAVNDYNQAIQLNSELLYCYNNRGVCLNSLGLYQEAIDSYNQAISLNQDADIYVNRGVSYDDLGEYNQAISDYNQAISLNQNLAEAYHNRGISYSSIGSFNEAKDDFKKASELHQYQGNQDKYYESLEMLENFDK